MANEDRSKFQKAVAQVIAAAWDDDSFLQELVAAGDDHAKLQTALNRKGIHLPARPGAGEHSAIKFVANTDAVFHMIIPPKPKFTDIDIGLVARIRQHQVFECCCDQSFLEFVKDTVQDTFEQEILHDHPDEI